MKFRDYINEASIVGAFFISPRGEIFYAHNHIDMIIKNPRKFGLTKEYIESIYDKYNERIGTEGRAREEIIKHLVNSGWIRIRRYTNRFWSVNVGKWSKRVKDLLWDWANKILKGVAGYKEDDPYMPVKIDVGDNYNLIKTKYTVKDISQDILYLKEETSVKKHKLIVLESIDEINESSLSRLWSHNLTHDCGAMTAFRRARECGNGEPYTKTENQKRNKSLLAKLLSKGYSATRIIGKYPEGGKETKEVGYFVVDLKDKGTLLKDLRKLGEEFEQDSVLYSERGFPNGEGEAFLIGTNHCENNWLDYGQKEKFKKKRYGVDNPIYTSYVNGRPFIFEEVDFTNLEPGNGFGWWTLHKSSEKEWENVDVE